MRHPLLKAALSFTFGLIVLCGGSWAGIILGGLPGLTHLESAAVSISGGLVAGSLAGSAFFAPALTFIEHYKWEKRHQGLLEGLT